MKKIPIFILILNLLSFNSCSIYGDNSAPPVHINRFDKDLFQLVLMDTPDLQETIANRYPSMLNVINKGMFELPDATSPEFFDRLVNYYSEPALNKLYHDALKSYDDAQDIEASLGSGFQYLKTQFPDIQIPAVYMHVSGLLQNVLIDDSLLSISIDKYLGADFPVYQDFFYEYDRRKMDRVYVAPDYLKAWILSEYPFTGDDKVLLERMIYEGKINYLLHEALPTIIPETLMGYTSAEYQWCRQNERMIWKLMIERKYLYTPDRITTSKFFSNVPATFIANETPGNLGGWMGWQIVSKYMSKNNISVSELMKETDYQKILTQSKYKP